MKTQVSLNNINEYFVIQKLLSRRDFELNLNFYLFSLDLKFCSSVLVFNDTSLHSSAECLSYWAKKNCQNIASQRSFEKLEKHWHLKKKIDWESYW